MAASLARVHSRNQVRRQIRAEQINIARVNLVLAAESNLDNIIRQREEVLRDLRSPRVGIVEGGCEYRALAGGVELEVDAALRENGGFELVEGGVEGESQGVDFFGGVFEQPVLHHEADFELAFDDGEEFGGTRVGVRGVHAAGLDEGYGAGNSFADEEGEVGFVGDEDAAAVAADGCGFEVEGDGVVDGFGVCEGHFAVVVDGEELLEAVDLGQVGVDLFGERCDGGWDCGCRDELGETGGLAAAAAAATAGWGGGVRGGGGARDRRRRRPRVGGPGVGVGTGCDVDGLGLGDAGCEGGDGELHHGGRHVVLKADDCELLECTKIGGIILGGKSV